MQVYASETRLRGGNRGAVAKTGKMWGRVCAAIESHLNGPRDVNSSARHCRSRWLTQGWLFWLAPSRPECERGA